VIIVTSYHRSVLGGARDFPSQGIQTDVGVQPASYSLGTGRLTLWSQNGQGLKLDHLFVHLMLRLRKGGSIPLLPSMLLCFEDSSLLECVAVLLCR
jgi:hypothetical protein